MCLEIIFEIMMVNGIAIIADAIIVAIIIIMFDVESWVICDIANAAPVLVF